MTAGGSGIRKPNNMKKPKKIEYAKIGRLGGRSVVRSMGTKHMAQIGGKGGKSILKKRGKKYMAELGRKGGRSKGAKKK